MAYSDPAIDPKSAFLDFIKTPDFPCVGAKSAAGTGRIKVLGARDVQSAWDDLIIHRELMDWAEAYRDDREGLRSFVVVFSGPQDLSEQAFETAMWERLQSLADKDDWLGQRYDDAVSRDPEDPHFALSFGGEAFFVVGLHPNASRPARRFDKPALVFNLHDQFERLREAGRYARMREVILTRDKELAGTVNPMLAEHGHGSAARQYSGRVVEDGWKCPFEDPRA